MTSSVLPGAGGSPRPALDLNRPQPLTIPGEDFDALAAGYETPEAAQRLDTAAYGLRSQQLKAILRLELEPPDPTLPPPFRDYMRALDVLARLRQRNQSIYDELLMCHPTTGLWASHVLRLANRPSTDYPVDFGAHLMHMGTLAAAGAIRAGMPVRRLEVPVWDGTLIFPTLGRFRLPPGRNKSLDSVLALVHVRNDGTAWVGDHSRHLRDWDIRILWEGGPSPNWEPRRLLKAGVRRNVINVRGPGAAKSATPAWSATVELDDLNLYGAFEKPRREGVDDRLDELTAARWQHGYEKAMELLFRDHPDMAQEITRLISILPLPPSPQRFLQLGASNAETSLSIRLSLPEDHIQFALGLVHEYAHNKFNRLLNFFFDLFYKKDSPTTSDRVTYSAWRTDPRPYRGHFHGTYASMCMAMFWRARMSADSGPAGRFAQLEFAQWRRVLPYAVYQLEQRANEELTPIGRRFLYGMSQKIAELQAQAVPQDIDSLAIIAALHHASQWRAYHLVSPEPSSLTEFLRSWPDTTPSIRVNPTTRNLGALGLLARFKVRCPEEFEQAYRSKATRKIVLDEVLGDAAIIAGDVEAGRDLFLKQLAEQPYNPAALAGLGIAETLLNPGPAADVILSYPHHILAINRYWGRSIPVPKIAKLMSENVGGHRI